MRPLPTTRLYQVRLKENYGPWARIWLTSDGTLAAVTDFGSFGYWWGEPGEEFRLFLTKCDSDYVAKKLAEGNKEIDAEATLLAVEREILSQRRRKAITRKRAREEWDDALKVDWSQEYDRCDWYFNETELQGVEDVIVYQLPRDVRNFMRLLWPLFVEELKKELEAESDAKLARELKEEAAALPAWFYTGHAEDERWEGGPHESREVAITEGRAKYATERAFFVVAEARLSPVTPGQCVSADLTLDQINCSMTDHYATDPDGEGVSYRDAKAAWVALEAWANEHIEVPKWWLIDGKNELVWTVEPPPVEPPHE